jgi:hypothetical protein
MRTSPIPETAFRCRSVGVQSKHIFPMDNMLDTKVPREPLSDTIKKSVINDNAMCSA